ncbi:MAG: hypothetical protein BAA03_09565 [Caldibacillus debilis]|nr:MAG: hypothetical protein BAA03_09565 [Caldibacillus debilis]
MPSKFFFAATDRKEEKGPADRSPDPLAGGIGAVRSPFYFRKVSLWSFCLFLSLRGDTIG